MAAFLVNSKVTVGAWFVSTGFFVAENPSLGASLARVDASVGRADSGCRAQCCPWVAVASAAAIVVAFFLPPKGGNYRKWREGRQGRGGDPAARVGGVRGAAALRVLQGHPVRIRYDVPLVAAAAALTGNRGGAPCRDAPAESWASSSWPSPPGRSRRSTPRHQCSSSRSAEAPNKIGRRAVTAYLESHWNGAAVLMSMGSLGHYMHDLSASGFRGEGFPARGERRDLDLRGALAAADRRVDRDRGTRRRAAMRSTGKRSTIQTFLRGYMRVAEGGGVGCIDGSKRFYGSEGRPREVEQGEP